MKIKSGTEDFLSQYFLQAFIWFENNFRIQLKRLGGVNSWKAGSVYHCFTLDHFTCQEERSGRSTKTGMVKAAISLKHNHGFNRLTSIGVTMHSKTHTS